MKKVLSLALVLVLLIGIFALPASAASSWRAEMGNFKPVSEYYASIYPKYLWALQRFLFSYPDTQDEMSGSTHDGKWGSKTRAAVGAYQRYTMGSNPDYIVGPNTWNNISTKLSRKDGWFEESEADRLVVTENEWNVFIATQSSTPTFVYYYGTGSNAGVRTDYAFHPYT